jgi:hypothetical protein
VATFGLGGSPVQILKTNTATYRGSGAHSVYTCPANTMCLFTTIGMSFHNFDVISFAIAVGLYLRETNAINSSSVDFLFNTPSTTIGAGAYGVIAVEHTQALRTYAASIGTPGTYNTLILFPGDEIRMAQTSGGASIDYALTYAIAEYATA